MKERLAVGQAQLPPPSPARMTSASLDVEASPQAASQPTGSQGGVGQATKGVAQAELDDLLGLHERDNDTAPYNPFGDDAAFPVETATKMCATTTTSCPIHTVFPPPPPSAMGGTIPEDPFGLDDLSIQPPAARSRSLLHASGCGCPAA